MKTKLKLENWEVVSASNGVNIRLMGKIFGHKNFHDDTNIYTSFLTGKEGESVLASNGSVYELGEPSRKYASKVKDAKQNLLNLFK